MLVPGASLVMIALFHLVPRINSTPLSPRSPGLVLNEFIRYYEPVTYDRDALTPHTTARRRRETLAKSHALHLDVTAQNRVFKLRLTRDNGIFANDVIFEDGAKRSLKYDPDNAYIGTLEDDELATVHGIITSDGLFDGTISTQLEDYYIEPVTRYLDFRSNVTPPYHSVVYRGSDVTKPSSHICASQNLHHNTHGDLETPGNNHSRKRRWFPDDEQSATIRTYSKNDSDSSPRFPTNSTTIDLKNNFYNPTNIYYRPTDIKTNNPTKIFINIPKRDPKKPYDSIYPNSIDIETLTTEDPNSKHVRKRATIDPKKTTCMLYLQADHLFYQKYGTEEACIEVMTRHVQRVNSIYKHTDFNQDGKPDNISFMIKRIKVHSTDALRDPTYRFPLNYGVEKFLELFSEEDYDAFCLAYMFTYRDFEMGTLGLAWTGDLKNAGGVCEKNGHYRGSLKSLNTGIVTLLNYGKHVPPAVSHVTLAHEIGHNFGSPHDPDSCTPGGEDGNYIMFARATSGDKKNNNKFSPCSLNSINPVLNAKARSPKGCFTEPQAAICGNGVVESGEECDCGWEEDCRDTCCFPQRRYPPAEEPPCRLTPHSVCSPSQGPCCTMDCSLKFADKCRDDNGCRDSSFCDGRGPHCPPSINKPNKTICNEEFVCFMGECTGSICLAYGLESCQCIPGPHDTKTKACELCCKLPGDDQPCLSSFDWNSSPYDIPDMYSKPGTPCNEYNGYCDVFQKCREVDPSGPLATLRKLLLSDESIASFKRWVTDHWYAVLLLVCAVLFLLVLSTKLLGKHPNLKLKSITIIHSSTTETVRLPTEGDGGGQVTVHPAAIRSKLPLKRKVREARDKHRRRRAKSKETTNNADNRVKTRLKKKKKAITDLSVKKTEVSAKKVEDERKKPPQSVKPKKNKKNKEVIDYSLAQEKDNLNYAKDTKCVESIPNDPVGKVKNWLLQSQQPNSALIPKSKSTPNNLTSEQKSPVKSRTQRQPTNYKKSRSMGNMQAANKTSDKVKLQVFYKPPFKFSLKFRKADKPVTSVVFDKSRADRKRPGVSGGRAAILVKQRDSKQPTSSKNRAAIASVPPLQLPLASTANQTADDIDSNIHTVPSDLEVLLSESEFLFSNA